MSYLRFTPREYRALCQLTRPLDLARYDPNTLRAFLVPALSDTLPALAGRIAALRGRDLRLVYDHLRERTAQRANRGSPDAPGLAIGEMQALADAFRSYPFLSRFSRYLRGSLVQFFRESFPALAAKLSHMDDGQFERLHQRVQEDRKRGPGKR